MDDNSTDVIQGTLDMLILKSLSLEPMHGFGIARRIEQISKGVFKVNPGSLMLAFKRMERSGLIDSEWRATENNRRGKFYRLTEQGSETTQSRDARVGAPNERDRAIARGLSGYGGTMSLLRTHHERISHASPKGRRRARAR